MPIKRRNPGGSKSAAITLLENRIEDLEEQLAEYQDFANRVNQLSSDFSDDEDSDDDEDFDDDDEEVDGEVVEDEDNE